MVHKPRPVRQFLKVHKITPSLYHFPKLRKLNFCFWTVCFGGVIIIMRPMALTSLMSSRKPQVSIISQSWEIWIFVFAQCAFGGASSSWGRWSWRPWCPHENPRSLSFPKAEKFDFLFLHSVFSGRGVIIMRPMALTSLMFSRKPHISIISQSWEIWIFVFAQCAFRWPWRPWCPWI